MLFVILTQIYKFPFLQELSSREDELRQIQMAQEVHAETLKKREEDLAQREMLLLGREISMLIQVGLHLNTDHFSLDLHCIAFSCNVRLHALSYIKHSVTSIVDSYIITKAMFIVKFLYLLNCLHCFTFTIEKTKTKK